jgi:glycosyltransferase involved in cell wall biosynthesis
MAMKQVLKSARLLVAVSNATMVVAQQAVAIPSSRWKVVPNGIDFPDDAKAFDPGLRNNDSIQILSVARLIPRKNIASAVRALIEISSTPGPLVEFKIAGRGSAFIDLVNQVEKSGLNDRISFLGYVPDDQLVDLYKAADIFIHPQVNEGEGNDFEGFGLVIADAMSFGCAVVAGKDGGPSDFVENGETGLLVDGSDQSAVTGALAELVASADYRKQLGANAREFALRNLSWFNHSESVLRGLD